MIIICISEALKNVKLQAVNKVLCGIDSSIRQVCLGTISQYHFFTPKRKQLLVHFPPWPTMLSRDLSAVVKSVLCYICNKDFSSGHEPEYKKFKQLREDAPSLHLLILFHN